jgi:hypothetical protein
MTDIQILTIAMAVIVTFSLLIYSNSRVNDAKEVLRAEMLAGFEGVLHAIENLEAKLHIHEIEHHSNRS